MSILKEKDICAEAELSDTKEKNIRKKRKVACPLCEKSTSRNNLVRHLKITHTKLSQETINNIFETMKLKRESDIKLQSMIASQIAITENTDSKVQSLQFNKEIKRKLFGDTQMDLQNSQANSNKLSFQNGTSDKINITDHADLVQSKFPENQKQFDSMNSIDFGLSPSAVLIMGEAKKFGSNLSFVEKAYKPVAQYVPKLLEMLTPQQCEWFQNCVFPWGYESPSASMLAYFSTLDFNNNQLMEENHKLISQLAEKERELTLFKTENRSLIRKLENTQIDNTKIAQFFSSVTSIDEAWEILQEAINKIETMQTKIGAFSGFADTTPDDPIEKGNGNPENYWLKKYSE